MMVEPSSPSPSFGAEKKMVELGESSVQATKHQSIAAEQNFAAEAGVRRKVDLWVLPLLTFTCLFCFIDRSNIGNANVAGLQPDLHMAGYDYNWASCAFFFTYILVEIPSNIGLQRFGGKIWLPMLTFLFGLVCFCTAFVKNFQSLVGMRILLGFAEGGILPGSAFYLSKFYRRYELGSRIGLLYTSTLLSGFFGGFLGAGMSQIPPFGPIHTWRNIFFFEGLIPMILAPVLWWVLPNDPSEARFLDDGQRALASKRMAEENELSGGEEGHLIKWRHIKIALGSINNWLAISVYAFSSVAPQSFFLFLPTIIAGMGYKGYMANLMSGIPFLVAPINLVFQSWLSDRIQRRGLVICYCVPFFALGFALTLAFAMNDDLFKKVGLRYMALFIAVALGNVGGPITLMWVSNNNPHPSVRGVATAMTVSLGTLCGFIASWTYTTPNAPKYITGHSINLAFSLLAAFLSGGLWYYCWQENKKRDRGLRDHRLEGLTTEEVYLLSHRHPDFRYSY